MIYDIIRSVLVLHNVIYVTFSWILSFIRYKKPPSIPPITDSLLVISATELAKRIREKQYTSYEVVLAYINRIKEVNPYVNAVVEDRFEDALDEAKSCDALLRTGNIDILTLEKQKPLYGVPVTIKETCAVKGISHTGGSLANKGRKAAADGVVVKRLRDAGAIPLCVTNIPEMCSGFDSYNYLYGRTYNPYDTRYTSGGSSGGEAALIGAGASLIGIGSDIAGSIRIPGLLCGIFGFKPSPEVVPSRGHYPTNNNKNFNTYLTLGPMVRYANDLSLVMKVISTKSNIDLDLDKPVNWKEMNVYYPKDLGKYKFSTFSISSELKQCILKAANHFSGRGVNTKQIEWPSSLFEMVITMFFDIGQLELLIDTKDRELPKTPIVELIKAIFGLSHHTISVTFFVTMKQFVDMFLKTNKPYYSSEFKRFRQKLLELLGKNGILIYPIFRITPAFAEVVNGELLLSTIYSILPNILGFPAIQIPMGLNSKRMPIGLQVIAAPYQDRFCLAAAKELERAFGGWVPPSISINN